MSNLVIPYVFQNQTTADANQVDQNFNAIATVVNGNLDDSNMKAGSLSASIATEGVKPAQTKGIPYSTDLYGSSSFVQSGLTLTKDGTNQNQVNLAAGVAHMMQTDGTLRRFSISATNFKTTIASVTYYLDLNPDGTLSWQVGHSQQTGYMTLFTVTSDASGNVSTITDNRVFGGPSNTATPNSVAVRDQNGNVITALPTANGQNPNLLFNPSARLGLAGWNQIAGTWSTSFDVQGGYFSVSSVSSSTVTLESQPIPAYAGIQVTVSAEIDTTSTTSGNQGIILKFMDTNGNLLSQSRVNAVNGTGWTKYTTTGTAPANTAKFSVQLIGDSGFTTSFGAWRKVKAENGTIATTFSDDNTLNTVQYSNVIPFLMAGQTSNAHAEDPLTVSSTSLGSGNNYPTSSTSYVLLATLAFTSSHTDRFVTPSVTFSGGSSGNSMSVYFVINGVTSNTLTWTYGGGNSTQQTTVDVGPAGATSFTVQIYGKISGGGTNFGVQFNALYEAKRLPIVGGGY